MGRLRYIVVLAAATAALAASSFAQTTAPGQGPPRTQAPSPQAPQVRAPTAQVRPNLQLAPQTIPVVTRWPNGEMRGPSLRDLSYGGGWPTYADQDHDDDGQTAPEDCDDGDARRGRHRTESYDLQGLDEDCDLATIPNRDLDGDGFISWRAMNIARGSQGQALAVVRGPDCDDERADTNPNMPEVLGDERDNNCDGDVDIIRDIRHRDYCRPTTSVAPANATQPCARQ